MLKKRVEDWRGIRRHGAGWQAEVRVTGHPRSLHQFPLDTDPRIMQQWRRDERGRLRLSGPARASKGTFAADAKRYLELVATMPSFKMRRRDILLWVEVFGTRPRASITRAEIRAQRDRWHIHGPKRRWRAHSPGTRDGGWEDVPGPLAASTVNHRLRALANLWTELDGLHAPNPAREVPELQEADGEAYGLPYSLIEMILAAMPDRGRPIKGAGKKAGGVKGEGWPTTSLTKLRARAIAYTGLSHAELGRLTANSVNFEEGWVNSGRRRKGTGFATGRRPLTPQGLHALRQMAAANAWGPFSASSMRKSIRGACAVLSASLAGQPGAEAIIATLAKIRPYDFRHSYVSEVLELSGDFHATRLLAGHADMRTTLRYGRRAVNPVLVAALAKVTASGGFSSGLSFAPEKRANPVSR